ncbi:MAG TPA: class I SAM-dependent methyltransferase [Pedobacter sp.]|jgi:ubiquinone/menaquinone biosynthesis C-methylase UbiE
MDQKEHWESVYTTKALQEVSWYEEVPTTSLKFLSEANLSLDAKIIDIGGGDSLFVDHLLKLGFKDITVLDISANAIERAKERLGSLAKEVKWVVSDATQFQPTETYDFWHDRAVFHFITQEQEITTYLTVIENGLKENGILVVGTFSENGPEKCSGIEIKQYSESELVERFGKFIKVKCLNTNHQTPFNTVQNFTFCSFKKN